MISILNISFQLTKKDININELLKEEYTSKLVACPSSPEEAKKIYNWLKEKGMIE